MFNFNHTINNLTNPSIKIWITAIRLRTLPLALASIGMGSFLAAYVHKFKLPVLIFSVLTTVLLQILSNLANDYGDSIHGADSTERIGPSRAVQTGMISHNAMKRAIIFLIILSLFSGIYLLYISLGFNVKSFIFFFVGILAILAAVAYTAGNKPYGYVGLGDLSVLIFFGLVGVLGTFYLHAEVLNSIYILPALSCGFFSMAVLNLNNIRDIDSDKNAGKKSIPVRIGMKNAIMYHWGLLAGGIITALVFMIIQAESYIQFLFVITIPLILKNALAVNRIKDPVKLDPFLRQMAITTLLFVITFGLGLLLSFNN